MMESKRHRLISPSLVFTLLASVSAFGCGKDDAPGDGELGSECDSDQDCSDELLCGGGSEGNLCAHPPGSTCDPEAEDLDNGGCVNTTACETPVADDDETTSSEPTCLILMGEDCEPDEPYCSGELTCAEVSGGGNRCFEPVILAGMVSSTADAEAIEGSHVIGIDDEGSAATSVAISDDAGMYELEVPVVRNEDGSPTKTIFTLRAGAQDYQGFPHGIRVALPIDTTEAQQEDGRWVVDNAVTQIGLIPLPDGERYSISGSVQGEADSQADRGGVMILADGPTGAFSATSDLNGDFTVFNVVPGDYAVSAYAAGLQVTPETTSVTSSPVTDLILHESADATVDVAGNIQIVNAGGGSVTSVILVVEATFDPVAASGETPRGLRAPRAGAPSIDGNFVIEDVPDGDYVVLAAYENDRLVRDPDTNISGTDFVQLSVVSGAGTINLSESFKVTEALAVMAPGGDEPEPVQAAPTLSWADDSSEDWYEVRVFDAFGDEVWSNLDVPSVSGKGEVSVPYGGPLEVGMYYQFRVQSWRQPGNGQAAPISATEDLRGVFYMPAP